MPSQLVNNSAIYFICARDFLYGGVEYHMGEEFPQEVGVGQIDLLVRTRRLFAVVDDLADKPRHWHHHVWERSVITKKLGLIKNPNVHVLDGSSGYNKPTQQGLEISSVDTEDTQIKDEPQDVGAYLQAIKVKNALTEQVLQEENDEAPDDPNETVPGETEPEPLVHPDTNEDDDVVKPTDEVTDEDGNTVIGETEEPQDEEREVVEDDLYDPNLHNASDVIEYLDSDISDEERRRVLAAEKVGKARKGVLNHG